MSRKATREFVITQAVALCTGFNTHGSGSPLASLCRNEVIKFVAVMVMNVLVGGVQIPLFVLNRNLHPRRDCTEHRKHLKERELASGSYSLTRP